MRQLHRGGEGSASFPAPLLAANSRFGSFKKEEEQGVRQLNVSGGELERLRRRRDALLSMTPEQALRAIEFHENLSVIEALALAKREGKIIVPHCVHDKILRKADRSAYLGDNAAESGTCVIYESPGKPFRELVVFHWDDYPRPTWYSLKYAVPQKFRGRSDCALVIEHPDYDIVAAGRNTYALIADEKNVHVIENFPSVNNTWYLCDRRFAVPMGEPGSRNSSRRFLFRHDTAYIGFPVRGFIGDYNPGWQSVFILTDSLTPSCIALF